MMDPGETLESPCPPLTIRPSYLVGGVGILALGGRMSPGGETDGVALAIRVRLLGVGGLGPPKRAAALGLRAWHGRPKWVRNRGGLGGFFCLEQPMCTLHPVGGRPWTGHHWTGLTAGPRMDVHSASLLISK
jgi:hypothetical protein